MAKFVVLYDHEVVITYEAIVEADSEEEAREKMDNFDIEDEIEMEYQGISIDIKEIEKIVD